MNSEEEDSSVYSTPFSLLMLRFMVICPARSDRECVFSFEIHTFQSKMILYLASFDEMQWRSVLQYSTNCILLTPIEMLGIGVYAYETSKFPLNRRPLD